MSGSVSLARLEQVARLNAIVGQLSQAAVLDKIRLTQEALALLAQMSAPAPSVPEAMVAALDKPRDAKALETALHAYLEANQHTPDLVRVANKLYHDKFSSGLPNLDSPPSEPLMMFDDYAHKRHKAIASGVIDSDDSMDAQIEDLRREVQRFKYSESGATAYQAVADQVGLTAIRDAMLVFRDAAPKDYIEQKKYYDEYKKERQRLNTAFTKAYNKADELYKAFCREETAEKVAQIQALLDKKFAAGVAAIAQINDWSSISPTDAQAWVAEQTSIEPAALARLKRDEYPTDIKQDLADFYRLTGGKLGKVALKSEGDSRANTRDVFGDSVHEVFMGRSFSRNTLFHELGHQLERDPVANLLANEFLVRRRESDQLYSLNELSGGRGYGHDEVAFKDSWISPYVGKRYRNRTTEVFSMAMEHLASPERAQILLTKDREMFDLVTGYITSEMSELSQFNRALSDAREVRRQLINDAEQAQRDAQEKIIDATILIDHAISEEQAVPDEAWRTKCRQYVVWESKKGSKAKWVGQYRHWLIYAGVFKDRRSRKWLKGFVTVKVQEALGWSNISVVAGDMLMLKRALWQQTHE